MDGNPYTIRPWLLTYAAFSIPEPEQNEDPIIHASYMGDLKTVIGLIKAEQNINVKSEIESFAPLHLAVMNMHIEIVAVLLETPGIELDAANDLLETPLHLAALNGDMTMIIKLLKAGASILLRDKLGRSPMHFAAMCPIVNAVNVIKMLCEVGSSPIEKDAAGQTPMHKAAAEGNASAIEALIEMGGNPSEPDNKGVTPLHVAADNCHKDTILALVKAGANVHVEVDGVQPIHIAEARGCLNCINELKKAGAVISVP